MDELRFEWRSGPTVSLVTVEGNFRSGEVADEIAARVHNAISNGRKAFVINFKNPFLTSIGIAALLGVINEIKESGGRLIVVGLRPHPSYIPVIFEEADSLGAAGSMLGLDTDWFEKELGVGPPLKLSRMLRVLLGFIIAVVIVLVLRRVVG